MGTDIHVFVEVKQDEVWKYNGPLPITGNYNLFAMLANVRNGYASAGSDTGDGFVPIAMPRGLPVDVTSEVQAELDSRIFTEHSHGWLSVQELLDYNLTQTTRKRGIVNREGYQQYLRDGKPTDYCYGVLDPSAHCVYSAEMLRVLDITTDYDPYTQVEWTESYHDCANHFWDVVVPGLQKLGAPDGVRIVFWFD